MKISLYTAMRNCVRGDYPFMEMLRHHLPLADEIVVNDGFSTDGTFEQIAAIDPKVRVFRTNWDKPSGEHWWIHFKDAARRQCTGDWCIHLDSDEFIPDWEFPAIRSFLASTQDVLVPVNFVNFYGNFRVYHANPASIHWITRKMIIHRNIDDLEFWGDGSNLKRRGEPFHWDTSDASFTVHHFGGVRDAARLREAWWSAGRFRTGRSIAMRPPRFVFDWFPHAWADTDFMPGLKVYDGPFIKAVQDNPSRFVRDDYELLRLLAPAHSA